VKIVTRKLWVLAFVTTWIVAPGFPSLVCALTLPSGEQSALAATTPDCHHAARASAAADKTSRPHRGCCQDAATSCCLRALDIDGAVGGVPTLDAGATAAVAAVLPIPATVLPALPVFVADGRGHSPPGSLFRVLRL